MLKKYLIGIALLSSFVGSFIFIGGVLAQKNIADLIQAMAQAVLASEASAPG